MTIIDQLDQDLVQAIKEGNELKRDTLRYLKSSLKNAEIEKQVEFLTDELVVEVIQKEVKKRHEAAESYKSVGKQELADKETQEIEILSTYLPAQMSEEEIRTFITTFLKDHPANPDQPGPIIGQLVGQLKGKADPSLVARLASESVRNAG